MVRPGTGKRHVVKAAGIAALLCTLGFAQAAAATLASAKSTKKPASHESSSTVHGSSASASHSSTTAHHASTSSKSKSSAHVVSHKGKKSRKSGRRGQQKIDGSRTVQIQEALIKQHYLSGEPNGTWDASTEEALRRYQADNGWQNKTVPDSRALIKLGLGPSHDHLLNPESAMTTAPEPRAPGGGKPASGAAEPAPASNQPN
jgi:Putative peptidoglycan binding domain